MADFSMTLAEAIVVRDHLRRLGYPNSWDRELLVLAENQIVKERAAVLLRWRDHKENAMYPSDTAEKSLAKHITEICERDRDPLR